MTNFRDALDHMSKIFRNLEENNTQKARENLGEMEAHIQRAAFDSAQSVPEKKLNELFDKRMESILYRITLSDAPSDEDYQDRLEKIKEQIIKGREKKAHSMEDSVKHFKAADDHVSELLVNTPSRREVMYRLVILSGVVITLISTSLAIYSLA